MLAQLVQPESRQMLAMSQLEAIRHVLQSCAPLTSGWRAMPAQIVQVGKQTPLGMTAPRPTQPAQQSCVMPTNEL
jgi:hypothetical protein